MAFGNRDKSYKSNGQPAQKADVILETNNKISAQIDALAAQVNRNSEELERALAKLGKGGKVDASEFTDVYNTLHEEYKSIRREMTYLATQNERIFVELSSQIKQLSAAIGGGVPQATSAPAQIDYDLLAAKVAELMPAPAAVSHVPVYLQYNEELADRIALKLGALKADDFEILVDDEGCSSISNTITEKLNYDVIAASISDKLHSALGYMVGKEPDYDEMASHISQKITVAAIPSAPSPEIDTDEIADKVVSQLLGNMPAAEVDSETICKNISEKLVEAQENSDYDIVLDEDGLNRITEYVADEIRKSTGTRLDSIDNQLAELNKLLREGATPREDERAEDSTLVTVSYVTQNQDESAEQTELGEELADLEEEIAEIPAVGEIVSDDIEDESVGVDFENMMKYNRSFIARIIQSTDEQKEYYGRVKTTLLSYSKVNSNVAWGAERFNKGRETVARFKIRGKTLCLYLALDPKDYEYSVYHHVDVSDNKSMHGTPMMIKIKSPRGVKKAIRLIDEMLTKKNAVKRAKFIERNYADMYPYESIEELIEDGLVKDVSKSSK